jgi:hypothetical protein
MCSLRKAFQGTLGSPLREIRTMGSHFSVERASFLIENFHLLVDRLAIVLVNLVVLTIRLHLTR